MPTVLRAGRFRFYFFSNEGQEPPHIHVKAAEKQAKYWLDPVELAAIYSFNTRELSTIEWIVREYRDDFLEAWNEHQSAQADPRQTDK
jgi:hypothetical protein